VSEASRELSAISPGAQPSGASLPYGATVTIFFSDIRGFTEYTNQHGDESAWRVLRQHNALVNKQVEQFGGRVVKTQGDSFMVYFPTARAAILCAVAIQGTMAGEAQNEPGARIELGIGINTGEPIQEGGDFFGSTVNLAARVCAVATPGQVLVSETTRHVAGRLENVEFVDRGLRELKGFPEPQRVYEVRWMPESRTGRLLTDSRELREGLSALGERFSRLGADLLEASRVMQETGAPPSERLARQLATLRAEFVEVRGRLLQRASAAGVTVAAAPQALVSLGALEPVLSAIVEAEASGATPERGEVSPDERSRQAALEAAVQRAIGVLNRVLVIMHRDDPAFQPLLECQAKASELRLMLSRVASQNPGYGIERVDEAMLPFADLVALVADRESLDDDRFAQLEGAVRRSFGRPLAVAVSRGRLYMEGADARAPRPSGTAAPAAPPAPAPAAVEPPARRAAPPSEAPPAPPSPTSAVISAAPAAPVEAAPADPRIAEARWWVQASEGWAAWRASGLAFAHAARAELARHPHLLGVPLQASVDGNVARSYFLLLEHLDRTSPGALRGLAERVLAAGGSGPIGDRLFQAMLAATNLTDTYADFVRDVIVAVIPTPGVWADGGVVETEEATTVVRRQGGSLGSAAEQELRVTEARDRYVERRFALSVGPLTTRFVYLKGVELKEPRDVVVRLTEEGNVSRQAWLLVQHMGYVAAPRRQSDEGTALPGLGRNYGGVWIAVFNSAPSAVRSFEVILNVSLQSQLARGRSTFAPTIRGAS
jgi:class 3 adenylate cyclase